MLFVILVQICYVLCIFYVHSAKRNEKKAKNDESKNLMIIKAVLSVLKIMSEAWGIVQNGHNLIATIEIVHEVAALWEIFNKLLK